MAKAKELPPDLPGAPAGDDKPPPKFGTAKPASDAGDLPRVVDPLERAVDGTTRYKVVCRNYGGRKVRYVLAKRGDEAGAVACYLKAEGLDREVARLEKQGVAPEQPELAVTHLPD